MQCLVGGAQDVACSHSRAFTDSAGAAAKGGGAGNTGDSAAGGAGDG